MLLVTHDIREAALLGQTISLLQAGRVVQQGAFADLAERPAGPFVTEFLGAQTLARVRRATADACGAMPARGRHRRPLVLGAAPARRRARARPTTA